MNGTSRLARLKGVVVPTERLFDDLIELSEWLDVRKRSELRHQPLKSGIIQRSKVLVAGLDPITRDAGEVRSRLAWGHQTSANLEPKAIVTEEFRVFTCERVGVLVEVEQTTVFAWIQDRCTEHERASLKQERSPLRGIDIFRIGP
jgi:hypothetical protein